MSIDNSNIVPQSMRAAGKQPLDGLYRFNTLASAEAEAYDGAIFYIVSLAEWYKFKSDGNGGFSAIADSAIDASNFATKTDIANLASKAVATESTAGLMSATNYVKLRDINTANITKVAASSTNGNIRINDAEITVYARPNNSSDRPVSDTEKATWNGKAEAVHVHNNYALTTHNHNTEYAALNHEHQVWDNVLGRYREKYVLANSQGGGGDATSLSGLALNNNATGETGNDGIYSASKIIALVAAKISEFATGFTWKPSVATYNDIATTYPTPVDGWTTITKDTDKTWRYDGSAWVDISASTIPLATQSVDGKMSAADKTKLDGVATGANNYVHPASHLASMITEETDKRFMTDTERTFIADRNKTITGTYSKLPSDYPAGKITVEIFSGVNIGLGATGANSSGVLETYIAPDRSFSRQILYPASGIIYNRFTSNNTWAGWTVYYSQQNLGVATGSNNGLMSIADKIKIDGVATGATNTPFASVNPVGLGVAAPGVATSASRADHVHPMPVKADVGLGNVDNTSDANKPVSTAQQSALDLKAPLASPTFTGTVTAPKLSGRKVPVVQSITDAASVAINVDSYDGLKITALAQAFTFNAPTGTPSDMQTFAIRIKDNGTSRALTWNAAFTAMGVALPTATVAGKKMNIVLMYDADATKWGIVSLAKEA